MYVPSFTCEYCEKVRQPAMNGDNTGVLVMCDCKESREAWERQHRMQMERRKRNRNR